MKNYLPWPLAEQLLTKHMKGESEEFCCHTYPIYLAYRIRQEQNLPLGHKKKKTPASARFAFRFFPPLCSFLFPLALFFKVT